MAKSLKTKRQLSPYSAKLQQLPRAFWRGLGRYWHRHWAIKVLMVLAALIIISVSGMYGIARWYMAVQSSKPLALGASFIPGYAQGFGVDPHKTLEAMLTDLNIKHLRLVGYWSDIEKTPGQYDFSELDWEFAQANEHGAQVSLSLGLRQPRWPECHMPDWAAQQSKDEWQPQLATFIKKVVERYRDNPALDTYQLENEYFLKAFGICPDFSRDRLINEYNIVKHTDPQHPVIIARSNNALGTPINEPTPDAFGVSVYKRVWDRTITKRYVEYPFPAWFYAFLAGTEKIIKGRDTVIHELQAEPWPPNGQNITQTPLAEQDKSMNAERLKGRFEYGISTGMKQIDLWGAEYWYYRKEVLHDPSVWNVAKIEYQKAADANKKLAESH